MSRKTLPLEPGFNNMLKATALFGSKKASSSTSRPFKNYYNQWFNTLKNSLLPHLRRAMLSASSPTLLATHVDAMHHHFQAYYEEFDLCCSSSINSLPELLFPEWRNSLEKPFLWLGDLHPYLFTNLLRSFLDDEETERGVGRGSEEDDDKTVVDLPLFREFLGHDDHQLQPCSGLMAWDSPSKSISMRVDQIECGLRLMVPPLVVRARNAQSALVERVGFEWRKYEGRKEDAEVAVGEAMMAAMEELVNVFLDANRLRKSVLADILNATNVYQAAQFFEGLARFLVGFHDRQLLREFEKHKVAMN
ncbi:protein INAPERTURATE POLLEN1-like [Coffea arabica]|uniref:Protein INAPERTURATE POLLEN1-like n=1 Tax=Coffea arabica TaxID=13443 RepID=A0ABM4VGG0_COFAR